VVAVAEQVGLKTAIHVQEQTKVRLVDLEL
jgi:hypothetical protein